MEQDTESPEAQKLDMLLESLSDLSEDDSLSNREKCFVFPTLVAAYYEEVAEQALHLMMNEAELDYEYDFEINRELKGVINLFHFNGILRIVDTYSQGSIIDPSDAAAFKALTSEDHAKTISEAEAVIKSMRTWLPS